MGVAVMNFIRAVFLCSTLLVTLQYGAAVGNIEAGWIPGIGGMTYINETDCLNDELLEHPSLSNALDCARSCIPGEKPKTCYYRFELERYPINGQACALCSPNVTNNMCPNCQCVPGDGVDRMALTVNRMLPGPTIQVCKNDRLVIDVVNHIDGEAVSIHWHGILQRKSPYYDGVPYVTQCPVQSANSFRYQYIVEDRGTHFWHAHSGLHKMDGIYGSLIVREPAREDPNSCLYKYDLASHVIVISDWMHEESTERYPGRITGVIDQLPDSILINGRGRSTDLNGRRTNITLEVFTVEPNQRFRFRLINAFCTRCGGQLTIEGHNLTVIALDGQPIVPVEVESINSFAGERYDFIINTNQPNGSYWIQLRGTMSCVGMQQLGILQYANASAIPLTQEPTYTPGIPPGVVLNPANGDCNNETNNTICISDLRSATDVDERILKKEPDERLYITASSYVYAPEEIYKPNTYNHFLVPAPPVAVAMIINNISFATPPAPPLSQLKDIPKKMICDQDNLPSSCNSSFCACTYIIKIKRNAVVEFVVLDALRVPQVSHPFHQHGFHYNVLGMGQPFGPAENATAVISVENFQELDRTNQIKRNFEYPPGKDTIAVPNNGYVIYRLRAHNPGYWLLHCHFIYHQRAGMQVIVNVGKKKDLPSVPPGFPKCGDYKPKIKFEKDTSDSTEEDSNSDNSDSFSYDFSDEY